ncbi:MAG: hypothetical protein JWQ21_78 [Herminiimonas sp.]|nr:hypothetical protein [Herminiimonas sp.]
MEPRVMATGKNCLEFALHENYPLRLTRAQGRRVECVSGIMWITAYDEPADFMLSPGTVFIVPNEGLALVEAAIGRCRVRIEQPMALHRRLRDIRVSGLTKLAGTLSALLRFPGMRQWLRSRN